MFFLDYASFERRACTQMRNVFARSNFFVCTISLILIRLEYMESSSDSSASFFFSLRFKLCSNQTLLSLLPVDNLPDVCKVLRAGIAVVQVISVLPHIDTDDGDNVGADVRDWVLVGSCAVAESILALVVHEPSPARTLDSCGAGVEDRDEVVDRAPAFDDGVKEGSFLGQGAVSLWAERTPEDLVVEMSTAVELNCT